MTDRRGRATNSDSGESDVWLEVISEDSMSRAPFDIEF